MINKKKKTKKVNPFHGLIKIRSNQSEKDSITLSLFLNHQKCFTPHFSPSLKIPKTSPIFINKLPFIKRLSHYFPSFPLMSPRVPRSLQRGNSFQPNIIPPQSPLLPTHSSFISSPSSLPHFSPPPASLRSTPSKATDA